MNGHISEEIKFKEIEGRWSDFMDINFINAASIGPVGAKRLVTIESVGECECIDPNTRRPKKGQCVAFEEEKPLVLNATNWKWLQRVFGIDTEMCKGKKVYLHVEETMVPDRETKQRVKKPCIRFLEFENIKCENCQEFVLPTNTKTISELVEYSKKHCNGKTLCLACMKQLASKQKEAK